MLSLIKRYGERGILFTDIAQCWQDEYGEELLKRTFQHQKSRIEELFNVTIACDRATNHYSIEDPDQLQGDGVRNWILNTFSVGNTLLGASSSLRERLIVENQPSSSRHHLFALLEAMKENRIVVLEYHSFKHAESIFIELAPYFVKMHNNRWYLYGVAKADKLKLYALDRIKSLEIKEQCFDVPIDFSPSETLHNAFGVTIYDHIPPTTITLRAYKDQYKYLDSLPLHHSQRIVDKCDEYATYELYATPTPEFYHEILRQGARLEVISPKKVRDELRNRVASIYRLYK